jgi:hypothetical protein
MRNRAVVSPTLVQQQRSFCQNVIQPGRLVGRGSPDYLQELPLNYRIAKYFVAPHKNPFSELPWASWGYLAGDIQMNDDHPKPNEMDILDERPRSRSGLGQIETLLNRITIVLALTSTLLLILTTQAGGWL